ncbi:hypothetical protein LFM09_41025 [Lentzea alba]|uniref:hypothetical protein n=1 Tax=Lentzea alba TaxID=2714351 RepID=UPI0039BFF70B
MELKRADVFLTVQTRHADHLGRTRILSNSTLRPGLTFSIAQLGCNPAVTTARLGQPTKKPADRNADVIGQ